MKRSEVREFVREGVNAITQPLDFYEGLLTDFNSKRTNIYPAVHLVLEENISEIEFSAPQDTWSIKLIIANQDKMGSLPDQYEHIVDDCDELAQKLIYKYRNIIEGYKLITMSGVKRVKFIKKYADCLTGIELTFDLYAPDKTNVC